MLSLLFAASVCTSLAETCLSEDRSVRALDLLQLKGAVVPLAFNAETTEAFEITCKVTQISYNLEGDGLTWGICQTDKGRDYHFMDANKGVFLDIPEKGQTWVFTFEAIPEEADPR